ncbi:hypothetical protein GCM10009801_82120 [Streptomyces albiaxialis]|uniref:Uncharacterized protein n=1 Tax=Streptomyces albiaxialis TaxID=329523 RepID=A0ABN2X8P8_9ACTN
MITTDQLIADEAAERGRRTFARWLRLARDKGGRTWTVYPTARARRGLWLIRQYREETDASRSIPGSAVDLMTDALHAASRMHGVDVIAANAPELAAEARADFLPMIPAGAADPLDWSEFLADMVLALAEEHQDDDEAEAALNEAYGAFSEEDAAASSVWQQ